jgi:hypothetical protein
LPAEDCGGPSPVRGNVGFLDEVQPLDMSVLLPNHKYETTQVSCDALGRWPSAYECFRALGSDDDEDFDSEICTIDVGGGGKTKVTDTVGYANDPSWGRRP